MHREKKTHIYMQMRMVDEVMEREKTLTNARAKSDGITKRIGMSESKNKSRLESHFCSLHFTVARISSFINVARTHIYIYVYMYMICRFSYTCASATTKKCVRLLQLLMMIRFCFL